MLGEGLPSPAMATAWIPNASNPAMASVSSQLWAISLRNNGDMGEKRNYGWWARRKAVALRTGSSPTCCRLALVVMSVGWR